MSIEAMKQALKALKAKPFELQDAFGAPDGGERAVQKLKDDAVLALGAAIEQAKQAQPVSSLPPRKPLTDEELDTLRQGAEKLNFVTLREFRIVARAVEAAHGIKE